MQSCLLVTIFVVNGSPVEKKKCFEYSVSLAVLEMARQNRILLEEVQLFGQAVSQLRYLYGFSLLNL